MSSRRRHRTPPPKPQTSPADRSPQPEHSAAKDFLAQIADWQAHTKAEMAKWSQQAYTEGQLAELRARAAAEAAEWRRRFDRVQRGKAKQQKATRRRSGAGTAQRGRSKPAHAAAETTEWRRLGQPRPSALRVELDLGNDSVEELRDGIAMIESLAAALGKPLRSNLTRKQQLEKRLRELGGSKEALAWEEARIKYQQNPRLNDQGQPIPFENLPEPERKQKKENARRVNYHYLNKEG